jgi:hypothetical protein
METKSAMGERRSWGGRRKMCVCVPSKTTKMVAIKMKRDFFVVWL